MTANVNDPRWKNTRDYLNHYAELETFWTLEPIERRALLVLEATDKAAARDTLRLYTLNRWPELS